MLSERILKSAMASKIAYARSIKKAPVIPMIGTSTGNTWMIDETSTGIHAYAWKNGVNSTLIAFKGSSSLRDFASCLNFSQTQFSFRDKKVHVHSGVFNMFRSIEGVLTDHLVSDMRLQRAPHVTFCGHSLGGAIAMLAAAYYGNLSNNNIGVACHTFGAPKVGDAAFLEWLDDGVDDLVNLVNDGDLVPALPLVGGYESKFILCNGDGNSWNPLKQHDLDTYIEFLRKDLEKQKLPLA
jgi:Lipase (class 3)